MAHEAVGKALSLHFRVSCFIFQRLGGKRFHVILSDLSCCFVVPRPKPSKCLTMQSGTAVHLADGPDSSATHAQISFRRGPSSGYVCQRALFACSLQCTGNDIDQSTSFSGCQIRHSHVSPIMRKTLFQHADRLEALLPGCEVHSVRRAAHAPVAKLASCTRPAIAYCHEAFHSAGISGRQPVCRVRTLFQGSRG